MTHLIKRKRTVRAVSAGPIGTVFSAQYSGFWAIRQRIGARRPGPAHDWPTHRMSQMMIRLQIVAAAEFVSVRGDRRVRLRDLSPLLG